MNYPPAYLITFTTYGTWLHGDIRGSADTEHNEFGSKYLPEKTGMVNFERSKLQNDVVSLNEQQRELTLQSILEVCNTRGWFAHIVHVLSDHVHAVVSARIEPEKIMTDFKRYATRALKEAGYNKVQKYWTRHGSTRYIWANEKLNAVVTYVKVKQGRVMSLGCTKQSPEC